MRILVIVDEHKIANTIKRGLEKEAYTVDVTYGSGDGLTKATAEPYDLVIVERTLSGNHEGLEIVRQMRANAIHTPILVLTSKDGVRDRVNGMDAGADDYLVKPFAFEGLLAKVRTLLHHPDHKQDAKLTYQKIVLDPINFTVTRDNKPLTLTHKEFALLEFFMRNTGRLLSKDMITQHVWDYDADILPNTVEVYVGYLRNKVEKPFKGAPLITTRRGFGYVFGEASTT